MAALTLSVAPGAEPVLLSDAKDHLRVDLSDDDTLITGLILAAKGKIEDFTGRKLITQTWLWTFDEFPTTRSRRTWKHPSDTLRIPLAPTTSIVSIKSTDRLGVQTTFDPSNFIVDVVSEPARIVLKDGSEWPAPSDQLQEVNAVEILFVVGYGTAGSDVPEELLLAIKELTLHFYENREVVAPIQLKNIPMGVLALIEPFRAWNRFGGTTK